MNATTGDATGPELRLALAMRGGASLAVWIGGACCEIDAVRTAARGDGFWGRLLERSGYNSVAVDILAGASAGGLNGAIYAASQQYGFDMHRLKGMWLEVGDTDKLLRGDGDAKEDGWPSLFKGDQYLFDKARQSLEQLAGSADAARRDASPPPIVLTLSATLVDPIRRPGRSPSEEPLTQLRFASGFRFEHPRHRWQPSDFPHGDDARAAIWSKLALAARSTSSFPAAFEAAHILSGRPDSFASPPTAAGDGLAVDMAGTFGDRGTPGGAGQEFLVSDGGILDNIPLGRALEAIGHASSDGPTDRYLVYVQPGGPADRRPGEERELRERRAALSVLQGMLAARLPEEGILGDLAALDDYNSRVERARSMRRSRFSSLAGTGALLDAAKQDWQGYRVLRAEEDQRLVSALLDDPIGVLGEDPFPQQVGGVAVPQDRWRSPLDAAGGPRLSREELAVTLIEGFRNRLPEEFPVGGDNVATVVQVGALPLLRITQLLIEWARYLESSFPEAGLRKGQLYQVAAFVRDAIDRPRRLGWVTLAATVPEGKSEADLREASQVLTGLLRIPQNDAAAVCRALNGAPEDVALRDAVKSRLEALDEIRDRAWNQPAQDNEHLDDLRVVILRDVLVPMASALRSLRPAGKQTLSAQPGAFLDAALDGQIDCALLEALEVVAYPEFASGLPGRKPVRWRRLSSANPTPLAPSFRGLLDEAEATGKWWDPACTARECQRGIHVNLKLAGNELANFSAFLLEPWRENDWLWGRLDAVPTLVDILLASPDFRRAGTALDDRGIEELVAGPAGSPLRDFILQQVLYRERPTGECPAPGTAKTEQPLVRIREELASTTGPMPELQRALVGARQWQILAEESNHDDPTALQGYVESYRIGAQTLHSPEVRDEVRQRLDRIADVGAEVAMYCAQLRWREKFLGTPEDTSLLGKTVRKLTQIVGAQAVKKLTDDQDQKA